MEREKLQDGVSGSDDVQHPVTIITGATSGIGLHTAKSLHSKGFHELDLASLQSVRDFVKTFKDKEMPLHVLINNGGIYSPPYSETKDGIESQFGVNYLSHFLLTHLLLEKLKQSAPSRIINVSSRAHSRANLDFDDLQSKQHHNRYTAYSRSKLAQIMSTYELHRRLQGSGVTVNALHPGVVNTGLWKDLPWFLRWPANTLGPLFFKTPEQGAQTTIWAATAPALAGVSGKYFVDCAEAPSSAYSHDRKAAQDLWRASMHLAGLHDDDDLHDKNPMRASS